MIIFSYTENKDYSREHGRKLPISKMDHSLWKSIITEDNSSWIFPPGKKGGIYKKYNLRSLVNHQIITNL